MGGPVTPAASAVARALLAAGPLLSADGSDSLSLDEALELLTATGWDLAAALLAAIPEALALRRAPHPHVATLRRRTAGFLAPWDGPAAHRLRRRRSVGALVDRNGLRPAAFAVTRDRLVAVASEAGAVPFTAAETVRRGRLGPGRAAARRPGRRAILEDTEAKARALRALPDPRRAATDPRGPIRAWRVPGDARRPTTSCATSPASTPNAPAWISRRWRSRRTSRSGAWATTRRRRVVARLDRPRRRPPPPGVRPGHEPGDRPRARAGRHGPAGRAGASAGAARRAAARATDRSPRHGRSSPTWTGSSPRSARTAPTVRTLDATWDPAAGSAGLEIALDRLATEAVARGPAQHLGRARRATPAGRSTGCRSRRSSRSAPSTPP